VVVVPSRLHQAKSPVSAALAGPYGHPFHPMLVAVPIGAWVSSLVFDVASQFVDRPGFLADGSVWLIGIGVLGALGAAAVGFLDLFAIPGGTRAYRTALLHMSVNVMVISLFAVDFVWRRTGYRSSGKVDLGQFVLSVVALAALGFSGYLGGKLAYRYGVRVAAETTQSEGYELRPDSERAGGTTR
jgi:uncharacterized membrane protein